MPPHNLRQLFLQHNAQTSEAPLLLEFTHAKGIYLYDTAGKAHIDLISGISVSNIGHSHPRVIAAIQEQVSKYMHLMVYGEYVQHPQVVYAQKLAAHLPAALSTVYFTNSGSEAIEGAMKLAKRATGRTQIIACKNAYHGSTQGALSIMGNEDYKYAFRPLLPGISFINFNEVADLAKITSDTACVIIEPIQGEAGIINPDKDYFKALRERCDATETLLIIDEIQCGFGRTGSLWAFTEYGIVPDVLILGKALGGGMPLGAFIATPALMRTLSYNPVLGHISTFGGHPVCCAAGLAAFEVLLEEGLPEQVNQKEALFRKLLVHPKIKAVRGKGLLLALEFDSFEQNKRIIDGCISEGVITDWFLHNSNSMRIAPPLSITEAELEQACSIILRNIEKMA